MTRTNSGESMPIAFETTTADAHRFVLLHHQSSAEEHWDVMLETESALTTWSIPPQCSSGNFFSCTATPLPPHRKEYLEYEGEVSGNRGTVSRIDAGTYEQLSPETFMLHGERFIGRLTLENGTMTFDSREPAAASLYFA